MGRRENRHEVCREFLLAWSGLLVVVWRTMESRHGIPAVGDSHEPVVLSSYSSGSSRVQTLGRSPDRRPKEKFPPIDEHLVVPEETTEEIIKGRRVKIMPSEEEHAETTVTLSFLISAHLRRGYIAAADLLTRVTWGSNFATDVCVRKVGRDPETGRRYLEELAFEIVNKQRIGNITDKADELTYRGVRRVFAIFVRKNQIGEWSKELSKFVMVDLESTLVDPVLVKPIAFKSILDVAAATEEVVQALVVKRNPAILAIRKKGERKGRKLGMAEGRKLGVDEGKKIGIDEGRQIGIDEGKLNGRRETLLEQLEERFGKVPATWRKRVLAADLDELRVLSKNMFSSSTIADVFKI